MKKYYFFRLFFEKGKPRVRALGGQVMTVPSFVGAPPTTVIDENKNVSSDHEIRTHLSVGDILISDNLTDKGTFYKTTQIWSYKNLGDSLERFNAPPEACKAYEDFLSGKKITLAPDATTSKTSKKDSSNASSVTRKSYFSRLRIKYPLPSIAECGFFISEDIYYYAIRNYFKNEPTLLLGPSGTGKTEVIQLIAKQIDVPYREVDMGAMLDPISGLLGTHRLKGKESMFDYAPFTQYIQEKGIVSFEELSRAPASANNILFPCLDSRRYLPVDIADSSSKTKIMVDDECSFFATANVGIEYTGTSVLDKALQSRFLPIEVGYLSHENEARVLKVRAKISQEDADKIVQYSNDIRDLYLKGRIGNVVGTRESLKAAFLVRDGLTAYEAFRLIALPLFEGAESDPASEKNIIKSTLISR